MIPSASTNKTSPRIRPQHTEQLCIASLLTSPAKPPGHLHTLTCVAGIGQARMPSARILGFRASEVDDMLAGLYLANASIRGLRRFGGTSETLSFSCPSDWASQANFWYRQTLLREDRGR